ncbi:MAG: TonB-dependent receptor, partial [Muribaculaceae bacterium]|nr:TonB-dependent receptor [Muribaculaceae bacterium]
LRYANERHVRTIGADINLRYRTNTGLGLMASYNYLHTTGSTIESQFSQPRPHSATWRIEYDHRFSGNYKLYAALSGRYLSHPDTDQPTGGAYSIWKLTFRQEFYKGISLNLAIENLFDYRPKFYYWNSAITTGIGFSAGLTLEIDRIVKH